MAMSKREQTALIIGAGPAGLTAAYELLEKTNITPIIFEATNDIGGISRTVRYKGNRIDIGGHRFFSKSDRVMDWWFQHIPLEQSRNGNSANGHSTITYQRMTREIPAARTQAAVAEAPTAVSTDRVMLVRKRKSRIYFLR